MLDKDDIIEKAKKLMGYQDPESGSTENEQKVAADKLQQLLEKYQLSRSEVESHFSSDDMGTIECTTGYAKMPSWLWKLAVHISQAFECRVLIGKYYDEERRGGTVVKIKFDFIGEFVDATVATYFFETLYFKLYNLATEKMREEGISGKSAMNAYRDSFITGAGFRLNERLRLKRKSHMETDETFTALVLNKSAAVERYMKQQFPRLHNAKVSRGKHDESGWQAGNEAGNKINIVDGITTAQREERLGIE